MGMLSCLDGCGAMTCLGVPIKYTKEQEREKLVDKENGYDSKA